MEEIINTLYESLIEVKRAIGARENLGRSILTPIENKQNFKKSLKANNP